MQAVDINYKKKKQLICQTQIIKKSMHPIMITMNSILINDYRNMQY